MIVFCPGLFFFDISEAISSDFQKYIEWNIEVSKKEFYPGRANCINIGKLKNTGTREVGIGFGRENFQAFSIEIRI